VSKGVLASHLGVRCSAHTGGHPAGSSSSRVGGGGRWSEPDSRNTARAAPHAAASTHVWWENSTGVAVEAVWEEESQS